MTAPCTEEHSTQLPCPCPGSCPGAKLEPGPRLGLHWRRGLVASLLAHALLLASLGAWAFAPQKPPVVICQLSLVALGTGQGAGKTQQSAPAVTAVTDAPVSPPVPSPVPSSASASASSQEPVQAEKLKAGAKALQKPPQDRPEKPRRTSPPRPKALPAAAASPQAQLGQDATSQGQQGKQEKQGETARGVMGDKKGEETVFSVQAVDSMPKVTRRATPTYPPQARKKGIEGRVLVRMVVDAQGLPTGLAVHSADPAGHFEEAALEAAARLRFAPGKKAGQAVRVLVLLPFDFRLR